MPCLPALQLAAYLSDYYPPSRDVARRFAAMTSNVADSLDTDGSSSSSASSAAGGTASAAAEAVAAQKQCKKIHWRARALTCHGAGALDDEGMDAADMMHLMVRMHLLGCCLCRRSKCCMFAF